MSYESKNHSDVIILSDSDDQSDDEVDTALLFRASVTNDEIPENESLPKKSSLVKATSKDSAGRKKHVRIQEPEEDWADLHEKLLRSPNGKGSRVSYGSDEDIVLYDSESGVASTSPSPKTRNAPDTPIFTDVASEPLALSTDLQSEVYQERRRSLYWGFVALSVVGLLQVIGLPIFYPDLLLLNISDHFAQKTIYLILLISTIVSAALTPFAIGFVSHKMFIIAGSVSSTLFVCSKFFSTPYVAIAISVVAGLVQGPFLVCFSVYVMAICMEYSFISGISFPSIYALYVGLQFTWTFSAPIVGVILWRFLLPPESPPFDGSQSDNATSEPCGGHFCWPSAFGLSSTGSYATLPDIDDFRMEALLGCFLVCSLGGALIASIAIPDIAKDEEGRFYLHDSSKLQTMGERKLSVFRCSVNPSALGDVIAIHQGMDAILQIPALLYSGGEQLLLFSILLQAFAQCAGGLRLSLAVAICATTCAALVTTPLGLGVARLGRVRPLLLTIFVHGVLLIVLIALGDVSTPWYYIIAIFWAIAEAVIQITTTVLVGSLGFGSVMTTFAFQRVWQTTGQLLLVVGLVIGRVCTYVILATYLCILVITMATFVAMEISIRLKAREKKEKGLPGYVPLPDSAEWIPHANPVRVCQERTHALFSRIPGTKEDMIAT